MSGCCLASLFCPVRCSSHVVFVPTQSPALGGARVFLPDEVAFSSRELGGRRSCTCGGTLYKGSIPIVFWHVQ